MKNHAAQVRAALMNTNAISMYFNFKLFYVMDSCYYRMKAHAAQTCIAVRVVLEAVCDCTAKAHHCDFNLSAFVLTVESYNLTFECFKKPFRSELITKGKLCVSKVLQSVRKSFRLFVVNATFRAFAVKSFFCHIIVLLVS